MTAPSMETHNDFKNGVDARAAARQNNQTTPTSGVSPGYIQANMVVLPSRYAADFRTLCARNPVPCPLIAESASKGCFTALKSWIDGIKDEDIISEKCDLRRDIPRYMVYSDSKLVKSHCTEITSYWTDDHVAFLIGCSYSFETELAKADLSPRHVVLGRNVPMYRTSVRLCPAGVFTASTFVVSMRSYKKKDIDKVRKITRRFGVTHGEPIDWGWRAVERLGIRDLDMPEWGDMPLTMDGRAFGAAREYGDEGEDDEDEEVPMFWGCGVTPQEAVMRAGLEGVVMGHAPGHMLVLDLKDEDIVSG
ncbi:hypothetical protein QQS21_001557 [Conoideocrella luteorostrata]|uniref:DUF1445 domain-containing protein n=1 Tax=Conoideocrella luteorostrata TaxID=1105319 RepID=A0AAJ0CXQ9_9HYPO|nr:hypothetical protein QQS21_001557 [Conoideocrella luteorostrata]